MERMDSKEFGLDKAEECGDDGVQTDEYHNTVCKYFPGRACVRVI